MWIYLLFVGSIVLVVRRWREEGWRRVRETKESGNRGYLHLVSTVVRFS